MERLTPISPGVVHSSLHRTRLKTTASLEASEDDITAVTDALMHVSGVTDARPLRHGYVIEHEGRPDIVENIGQALAEVSPALFENLTQSPARERKQLRLIDPLCDRLPRLQLSMPEIDFHSIKLTDCGAVIKKAAPFALLGTGVWMIVEGEAILSGIGPFILFYLAYDAHWKMQQERALNEIVAENHE